jgi:hypothetical protein
MTDRVLIRSAGFLISFPECTSDRYIEFVRGRINAIVNACRNPVEKQFVRQAIAEGPIVEENNE